MSVFKSSVFKTTVYLSGNPVFCDSIFKPSVFSTGYCIPGTGGGSGGGADLSISPFGGWGTKEDRLAFIRIIDEMDIPIIANFTIQYIYKTYFKSKK
jgi:hypothetical protein